MREKYETLTLVVLKDIVKGLGVKGYSTMSKDQIIDILVEEEKKRNSAKEAAENQNVKEVKVEVRHPEPKTSEVRMAEAPKEDKKMAEADYMQPQTVSDENQETTMMVIGAPGYEQEFDPRLDTHVQISGIVEIMQDGYGFIRDANYTSGDNDIYVSHGQIKKFGIRTGDFVTGNRKIKTDKEKYPALLYISKINDKSPEKNVKRCKFEDMTPEFPDEKIRLSIPGAPTSMRIMDLVAPVGKGQRGMIVSQPKAGKTTLLKDIARSILYNNKEMHMIILLIDERPEEVTDIKRAIKGPNVEVISSTFDEKPDHHKKVAEMTIERAKRLVESKEDVIILLDSITRLTRANNMVVPPSGRTLSGGLDPAALHMPKKFFGAARKMNEGGSLTILATALVETGSKMDDVVYEEFKGTGNMELVLDRKLSEKRVFPAIDIIKSGTRNENLLLNSEEYNAMNLVRRRFNGLKPEDEVDDLLNLFARFKNNEEVVAFINKNRMP